MAEQNGAQLRLDGDFTFLLEQLHGWVLDLELTTGKTVELIVTSVDWGEALDGLVWYGYEHDIEGDKSYLRGSGEVAAYNPLGVPTNGRRLAILNRDVRTAVVN